MGEIDPEWTEWRVPVDADPDRDTRLPRVGIESFLERRDGVDQRRVGIGSGARGDAGKAVGVGGSGPLMSTNILSPGLLALVFV